MKKYRTNFVMMGVVFTFLVTALPCSAEVVTIVNSVHAESSTGGQSGGDGSAGSDGVAGKDGMSGTSGTSVIRNSATAAVSVRSTVNGQTIIDDSMVADVSLPDVSISRVDATATSSSTEPAYQIVLQGEVTSGESVGTALASPSRMQEFFSSIHNLLVSYASAFFDRTI